MWSRETTRRRLTLGLSCLALAAMAILLADHTEQLRQLAVRPWSIIPLCVTIFGGLAVRGAYTKLIAGACGAQLGWRECVGISIGTTALNYLTPVGGGTLVRAAYLKRRYQISYAVFSSTLTFFFLVQIGIHASAGLIILTVDGQALAQHRSAVAYFFGGIVAAAAGVLIAVSWLADRSPGILRRSTIWMRLIGGMSLCRDRAGRLAGLILLNAVFFAASQWFAFRCLGISLSLGQLVLMSALSIFGFFVSITPGSLGVAEACAMLSGNVIGISAINALTMSLIHRCATMIVLALASPVAVSVLGRDFWKQCGSGSPTEPVSVRDGIEPDVADSRIAA